MKEEKVLDETSSNQKPFKLISAYFKL